MSLGHVHGDTYVHRLDPRTKLLVQAAFAVAAVAHTTVPGLLALSLLAGVALALSGTPLGRTLWGYRSFAPFLVAAPLVEAATLQPPYLVPADAVAPALASYRVVLLLLVSAAYLRTTPVRESRTAIQWFVPGRAGVLLGTGVAFVLRFLPLLKRDLATIRAAGDARLADRRSTLDRIRLVGVTGLRRVLRRADGLALALQARCFAWNPTLPPLAFGRRDAPALVVAAGLVAAGAL